MSIIIEHSGLFSSFQDFGRKGYEHYGVIPGGALDELAHEIANRLVANDKNEATLEMTHKMASIRFTEPALIALTGGNFKAETRNMKMYPNKLYLINKGEVLKFNETSRTSRVYLAVGGGFKLDEWLNSTSTDFNVKIGGFKGRKLKKGDEIDFKRDYSKRHYKLFNNLSESCTTDWGINSYALSFNYISDVFHVIKNKGTKDFKKNAIRRFTMADYKVSSKTNRVGMILDGQKIKAYYDDMPAHQSVKRGTIQVKRDGTPIVLLNDHYTLGSYPQIGTIASYHLTKLAQKPQRSKLKFQFIDVETAEKNLIKYSNWLNQLFHGIEYRMQLEMLK
ncbi:biotin-dependent carboxyltransferase family protein [Staphylococcus saccharolyticus]|uniref:5-oxoprolinase subunit C family protein n=1 Tax=Staphylococcus saccharolyticus TaxID=33028 RepID=UPI00102D812C|nr:biotin-dependent carboxyltransferase family protein [Staphylococcus saccharolyticus]MBL7572707.1 biotin-dependent carboxyltransferase family protein [Staphylococcus saccharolyticus]MBL7584711.1 biotin-dependent carboxyltransferase family protein [Staphylococcus saccharolyticus]MBL7638324.1 biotin-dependent carboxyltransferase family protein [Staphylococcus saccharolyticus]QRJ68168.1 biotin-dependent carboxyltransferase family protein [Staphylococcus saccharolyticus]TAA93247.1 allophanate hy